MLLELFGAASGAWAVQRRQPLGTPEQVQALAALLHAQGAAGAHVLCWIDAAGRRHDIGDDAMVQTPQILGMRDRDRIEVTRAPRRAFEVHARPMQFVHGHNDRKGSGASARIIAGPLAPSTAATTTDTATTTTTTTYPSTRMQDIDCPELAWIAEYTDELVRRRNGRYAAAIPRPAPAAAAAVAARVPLAGQSLFTAAHPHAAAPTHANAASPAAAAMASASASASAFPMRPPLEVMHHSDMPTHPEGTAGWETSARFNAHVGAPPANPAPAPAPAPAAAQMLQRGAADYGDDYGPPPPEQGRPDAPFLGMQLDGSTAMLYPLPGDGAPDPPAAPAHVTPGRVPYVDYVPVCPAPQYTGPVKEMGHSPGGTQFVQ